MNDVLGPVFCPLFGISSDYAHPLTGQVTEVPCPVTGRAQPELIPSKRQKMGPDRNEMHIHPAQRPTEILRLQSFANWYQAMDYGLGIMIWLLWVVSKLHLVLDTLLADGLAPVSPGASAGTWIAIFILKHRCLNNLLMTFPLCFSIYSTVSINR